MVPHGVRWREGRTLANTAYRLLVNPTAGRGQARRIVPVLRSGLETAKVDFDLRVTMAPGDARRMAQEAVGEGVDTVVAVGGDGTVQEVANGVLAAEGEAVVGVVPAGSGNDFARAAGVPADPEEALAGLLAGGRHRVDVGWFGPRAFVNGLGIGLDGAVAMRYARMRRFRGHLGYMVGAVQEALAFHAFPVQVEARDWSFEGRVLFTGATNGPSHGGDFRIAPRARVDDGLLDAYVFEDMPRVGRLLRIPQVRRGEHEDLAVFHATSSPWVEIELDRPTPAHMDGEPLMLRPNRYRVEVQAGALELAVSDAPAPR